eukprot:23679-Eustigmatos_ZCMA.PRE.1
MLPLFYVCIPTVTCRTLRGKRKGQTRSSCSHHGGRLRTASASGSLSCSASRSLSVLLHHAS